MIVNPLKEGWEVIYQRSHAILAAELTATWPRKYRHPRWTETLVAVAQHDDQENFWDGSHHLSELGAPLDFTQMDLETNKIKARSVISAAGRQSRWVALLISCHHSFLYESLRGEDAEMDAFLDEQIENQRKWRQQLSMKKAEVDRVYAMMRWGDRLSLILCKHEIPSKGRALEITPGPDGERYEVSQREDDSLTITPWSFEEDRITFSVEKRVLKQLSFESEAAFREAMETARIITQRWEFVK
ncbi:MAG: DUF3891 family protein [Anaerolineae bacterium]|nr:DUF3891 family protein [Anaerolineae bacterium]